MIVKVILTNPTQEVPVNNQHMMNGFIHSVLGKNNIYHDTFSEYAISSLQGGKLDTKTGNLRFDGSPFIVVSSENTEFLNEWVKGCQEDSGSSVYGMKIKEVVYDDFKVHKFFDHVITISPVIVKVKGRNITVKDENWVEALTEVMKGKLVNLGIEPDFSIEVVHPEKAKRKAVMVGNIYNPCSIARLKITGSIDARRAIYNMGLGGSTGSGFGSVKIYE